MITSFIRRVVPPIYYKDNTGTRNDGLNAAFAVCLVLIVDVCFHGLKYFTLAAVKIKEDDVN